MGIFKLLFYICFGYFMFLAYAPNLLDIKPNPKNVNIFKSFEGPLKPNERLSKAQKLFENKIAGPESLVLHKGVIYTGTENGDIVAITGDKNMKVLTNLGSNSRPLGICLHQDSKLYIADALNGIISVDIKTGKSLVLLSKSKPIDGKKMKLPDGITVDKNGIIYFTDASTRWELFEALFSIIEHDKTGRLIRFDPKIGKVDVLVDKLSFPTGVQVSHDGKSLIFSEALENRVFRYYLEGPKKGQAEIFANLPGSPSNVRLSSRGGYWVALSSATNESSIGILERATNYPLVRKVMARFFHSTGSLLEKINTIIPSPYLSELSINVKYALPLLKATVSHCAVIELDVNGKIIRSLQSSDLSYCMTTEVLEDGGYVYLASLSNTYLIKAKL